MNRYPKRQNEKSLQHGGSNTLIYEIKLLYKFKTFFMNIQHTIESMAARQMKVYSFSKEWTLPIILTFLFLIVTMLISVYTGNFYFREKYLAPIVSNPIALTLFAWTLAIIFEILANLTLSKFFKYLYRSNIVTALILLIPSALLYIFSFWNSCEGLAMAQAQKVDETVIIVSDFDKQITDVKQDYSKRIASIENEIETIKRNPQLWKEGKRTDLSSEQLADIKAYNQTIIDLRNEQKTDIAALETKRKISLSENKTQTENTAAKYYNAIAFLMVLQLLANGLINFFWFKIYVEQNKTDFFTEELTGMQKNLTNGIFSTILNDAKEVVKTATGRMKIKVITNDHGIKTESKTKNSTIQSKIGFSRNNDSIITNEDTENQSHTINRVNDSEIVCKHCGQSFNPYNRKQVFCSDKCRYDWHYENKGFEIEKFLRRK